MKPPGPESPVVLVKWYDYAKWLLERVENFPKSQRFVLGQRLAEQAMDVLDLLVEAFYARDKAEILATANRKDGSPALDRPHGQGPQAVHRRAIRVQRPRPQRMWPHGRRLAEIKRLKKKFYH